MGNTQYAEMKDSGVDWIGMVPKSWNIHKAKLHINITNGSDPETEGNIPVYGSGNNSFRTCGEFKEGPAVLVGRKGSIDKPRYLDGCYWNVDTAFDVKAKDNFSLRLYYYLALCFDYQYYVSQTTLPSMTQTNYRNMFLPVPPNPEQTAIASYLDDKCSAIDDVIAQAKETIEEYKSWKASVIFEAVTKGLDPNVEMKDSGVEWIGKIPMAWKSTRLKVQVRQKTIVTQETTGYIGLENVKSGSGVLVPCSDENFEAEGQALVIHPGDVIFGKLRPYLAKCYVVKESGCCSSEFLVLTPKSINGEFLKYVMLSPKFINEINMATYGTKMPRANWYIVGGTYIPVPREEEQIKIVQFLNEQSTAIDSIISEKQVLIDELESYKKSLIFETVTGKRRVC